MVEHSSASSRDRPRFRLGILWALLAGFVTVAAIGVLSFALTVLTAADTTEQLVLDRHKHLVDSEVQRVSDHLDNVGERLQLLAALVGAGHLDARAPEVMQDALAAGFAGLANVSAIVFVGLDEVAYRVLRLDDRLQRDSRPLQGSPGALERFRKLRDARSIFWGELFRVADSNLPMVNVRIPLRDHAGNFLGGLVATVTLGDLSRAVTDPESGGEDRGFILAGRDRVLAHRNLIDANDRRFGTGDELPGLAQIDDRVLEAIWSAPARSRRFDRTLRDVGHVIQIDGREFVFIYRTVAGYSPESWTVGRYFPLEVARRDIAQLVRGIYAGGAALAAAFLLAAFMGLRMARSIRRLGRSAELLADLDFATTPDMQSRLRELDEAGAAMARAHRALRWFAMYVPNRLVRRLMAEGEQALASRRRTVTVMFTDIVGFTPQAEEMDEIGSADLLNRHFALLGGVIDREAGMIDKYIGDSIMAVWGAIHHSEDHADAACRAALAIAAALHDDNAARRARGELPIRLRIGLHSGPVTIGNIGAPGRINYTVVGDSVNVAQRMEQLGKQYMAESEDCIILASAATLAALQDRASAGPAPHFVGEQPLRGRQGGIGVYRLDQPPG